MSIRKILAASLATLTLTSCDNKEQSTKQASQKSKTASNYSQTYKDTLKGANLEVLTKNVLDYGINHKISWLKWSDYWGTKFPLAPADKYIIKEDKGKVYVLGFDPFGAFETNNFEGRQPVYRLIGLTFVKQGGEWAFKDAENYRRGELSFHGRSILNELINLNE